MKTFNKSNVTIASILSIALGVTGLAMAATTINLGTANTFAVLAGSGITITGAVNTTTITGDIGTYPTPAITGLSALALTGINHADDATTIAAKNNLLTAYGVAASSSPVSIVPTELGGTTKVAGAYLSPSGTFGITGTVTLDAQGDPNAVFIFQSTSTLITAGASSVRLINGAQACNVYWQVGSSATLGAASTFKGVILALTSVTVGSATNVEGRIFAQNGAVTLNTNTIAIPQCKGTLRVVKEIVTVGGGVALPKDFVLHMASGTPLVDVLGSPQVGTSTPGTSYTVNPGTYKIYEDATSTYTQSFSTDCPLGVVTIAERDNKVCTVTNTYIIPAPVVIIVPPVVVVTPPAVISSGGSYFVYTKPIIKISKIAFPVSLPYGGGAVSYDYLVSNGGTVPMSSISVTDNKCFNVRFVSGDSNNDSKLDLTEIWKYSCSMTLSESTTNIAVATGYAQTFTVIDAANATVIVAPQVYVPVVLGTSTIVYPSLPDAGFGPDSTEWTTLDVLLSTTAVALTGLLITVLAIRFSKKSSPVIAKKK